MQTKKDTGTPAQRAELLRKIKTYNPRMTTDKLDALIADQGIEILEISVRGTVEKMAKTANKSRSPLAGLLVDYKATVVSNQGLGINGMGGTPAADDMGLKLEAMEAALEIPPALVDGLARNLSEQQRYDIYEYALSRQGKRLTFEATVKARKSRRSPLAGMFKED